MALLELVLVSSIVCGIVTWYFLGPSRKTRQLINRIPGPPGYPIVGNAVEISRSANTPEYLRLLLKYSQDYGDKKICRLWLGHTPMVLLFKAETAEVVLRSNTMMDKAMMYDFIQPWLGLGLLTSTGEKWKSRRRLLTPTFHFKILQDFLQVFNEQSEILVEKLQTLANGREFDIFQIITLCALDIICETAMGTSVEAQKNNESDYVQAIYKVTELLLKRMFSPWLHSDIVFNMTRSGKQCSECLRVLHGFTEKVIKERKAELDKNLQNLADDIEMDKLEEHRGAIMGKKKRLAFLDMLLYASKVDPSLDFLGIREEVDTFLFEGHDTTAAGISWAIYLIGSHPDVQAKLHEEMDDLFGQDNRPVTMDDVSNLKYLDQVIKEAHRVLGPVPSIARKITEECEIAGYTVPPGTMAMILPFCIHRDPEHFPDPEKFDPDRWLPELAAKRHPYCYVPFSAGIRNCIGQKFAMIEEKVVLSSILRHFNIESTQTREGLNLMAEFIMRPQHGILVKLTSRLE